MNIVLFYHSITSCWNNGNAHFLRGIAREMVRAGHRVTVYEDADSWSRVNALAEESAQALAEVQALLPGVTIEMYSNGDIDLDRATDHADLIIVHEWTPSALVTALGRRRMAGSTYTLLFHDTHHRAVTAPDDFDAVLEGYDAVLAFGASLTEIYLKRGWAKRVFTWHEAADTTLFRPLPADRKDVDLIWIGNWGDDERSRELESYLVKPAVRLSLSVRLHGVRYPARVRQDLGSRGIALHGWLPNHRAPEAFARARVTVHIPRGPYLHLLPGIPTIRMFEALACGIPLVSAPWADIESLFPSGAYLCAHDENEMTEHLSRLLSDEDLVREQCHTALRTIREHHTCAHRVSELLAIVDAIRPPKPRAFGRMAAPAEQRGILP